MGAGNVTRVAQAWGVQLAGNRTAMLALVLMAAATADNGDTPTYYGGWERLADGLGLGGSEASRQEGVRRTIAVLVDAGAVKRGRRPGPGQNAEYMLSMGTEHPTPAVGRTDAQHPTPTVGRTQDEHPTPTVGNTPLPERGTRSTDARAYTREAVTPSSSRPPLPQPSPDVPPETTAPATKPGAGKPGTSPRAAAPRRMLRMMFVYEPQIEHRDRPDEVRITLSWREAYAWMRSTNLRPNHHRGRKCWTLPVDRLPDLMAMAQAEGIRVHDKRVQVEHPPNPLYCSICGHGTTWGHELCSQCAVETGQREEAVS